MAHFYGHQNCRGVGTTYQRRDGTFDPLPGRVTRFGSRAARDAWVDDDPRHREAVRSGAVRRSIEREQRRGGWPVWEETESHEYLVFC